MAWRRGSLLALWLLLTLSCGLVKCQNEAKEEEEEEEEEKEETTPSAGQEVQACPLDCTCDQEDMVDCGGVNLIEFPRGVPETTRHLSLQNNQINKVTLEELSRLHSLETLNLQNNRLTSDGLDDEAFELLDSLQYLYLANNKLTVAPKYLPPSLVSADFAANQLTRIYPYTFGQKSGLKSVYLHNNKLTDAGMPDQMFNGSDSLEELILSSNFLKYVPKNLPPALHRLHLRNNKLEKIPKGAFDSLSKLRELYLQNNHLSNAGMDNETFYYLNSLVYLDLSYNNLSVVPSGLPRNLVLLHLEKNAIRSIPAMVLSPVRNLEYLLLHNNKLRWQAIHPQAFQGLKKLHTLHMYNNQLERIPRGLPRRAKTLMLLHNQITEISRNDLATAYTVTELNLSYNKLTSPKLHREAFRKLRLLLSLDLSGNSLQTFPTGLPKSLQVLKLKDNELAVIPDGALSGMGKLREVYLSSNKLKVNSIYQGAWQELTSLSTLDLSSNQLSHIPSDLPESLEFLHLQNNFISSIAESAFESTPNIKGIFLRFNRLAVGTVKKNTFVNLKSLQVLDLGPSMEMPGIVSKNEEGERSEEEEEEEELD